jgi:Rrf2 family protein
MSTISTRSRYGLRLLVDLAEQGAGGPVDLHSIAERQAIPESYLSKLARALLGAGLIRSVRGAGGGYVLAKAPEDLDILTVVEVLEGPTSLLECRASPASCPRSSNCGARGLWAGLEEAMRDYLAGKTIAQVASGAASPEYYI